MSEIYTYREVHCLQGETSRKSKINPNRVLRSFTVLKIFLKTMKYSKKGENCVRNLGLNSKLSCQLDGNQRRDNAMYSWLNQFTFLGRGFLITLKKLI